MIVSRCRVSVSTIKKILTLWKIWSWFCLDGHMQLSFFNQDRDLSDFCDFCGFLDYFSDREITDFLFFTNIPIEILVPNIFCLHFVPQNWLQYRQKVWEIQILVQKRSKSLDQTSIILNNLNCLQKSWVSQFIHIILMQILTWPSLDLKNLDFKNLDQEKKTLVLTWWTISISISSGLDFETPKLNHKYSRIGKRFNRWSTVDSWLP